MCSNTYTILQVFSYNRLFEGHIICVVMLILYFKYSVTTYCTSSIQLEQII